ncbi:MAG: arsenate reductase (glutaredoxin) [Bacteroidetes bacterium]|nr:arsenate reductase (glutaredoxin) [Bacteroidota bacterium]
MIKIYHNPQCKKSRAGLEYLKDKGIEFEIVEYQKELITEEGFEKLLVKLNAKPEDMVRTQEEYFKKRLKGKQFNDHEWIKIIVQNPKLLKRPIVEAQYKAVWGDPVERIEEVIKNAG